MIKEVQRFEFVVSPKEIAVNQRQTAQIGRFVRTLVGLQDLKARIVGRKPNQQEIIDELQSSRDKGFIINTLFKEMSGRVLRRPRSCCSLLMGYNSGMAKMHIAVGDGVNVKYGKIGRLKKDGWDADLPITTMSFMYSNGDGRKNRGPQERFQIMNNGCAKFKMISSYFEDPLRTNEIEQHMFNICYNNGFLDFTGVNIAIRKDPYNLGRLRKVLDLSESEDYEQRVEFLSHVVITPRFKMMGYEENGILKWDRVKNVFNERGDVIRTRDAFDDELKSSYMSILNVSMEHLEKSVRAFSRNLIESSLKDSKLKDNTNKLKRDQPVKLVNDEYKVRKKLRRFFLSKHSGDKQKLAFRIVKDMSMSHSSDEVDKKVSTKIGKFQHLSQLKIQLFVHLYIDIGSRRPDVMESLPNESHWSLVRDMYQSRFNSSLGNTVDECRSVVEYIRNVKEDFCSVHSNIVYDAVVDSAIELMSETSCVDDVFLGYDELDGICSEFLDYFESHENPNTFIPENSRILSYKNNDYHNMIMECCHKRRKEMESRIMVFKDNDYYKIPPSSSFLSLDYEWSLVKVS